jgi:hypothetical protein
MMPDTTEVKLSFAITFYDGFTGESLLADVTKVTLVGLPIVPVQKESDATYMFFDLKAGAYHVQVQNKYYLAPNDIAIALPMPNALWPAYPDVTLADPTKPLDDPGQTPAYLAQRRNVTLIPAAGYPFPNGATLVRGTVRFGGNPLAGAQVGPASGGPTFPTSDDGQYMLMFPNVTGSSSTVSLRATHPLHTAVVQSVTVQRGMTVRSDFTMA